MMVTIIATIQNRRRLLAAPAYRRHARHFAHVVSFSSHSSFTRWARRELGVGDNLPVVTQPVSAFRGLNSVSSDSEAHNSI